MPCTNCTAFSIECRIPTPKRKKTQTSRAKDTDGASEAGDTNNDGRSPGSASVEPRDKTTVSNSEDGTPANNFSHAYAAQQATHNGTYVQFMKPKFARAPIKEYTAYVPVNPVGNNPKVWKAVSDFFACKAQ